MNHIACPHGTSCVIFTLGLLGSLFMLSVEEAALVCKNRGFRLSSRFILDPLSYPYEDLA